MKTLFQNRITVTDQRDGSEATVLIFSTEKTLTNQIGIELRDALENTDYEYCPVDRTAHVTIESIVKDLKVVLPDVNSLWAEHAEKLIQEGVNKALVDAVKGAEDNLSFGDS